MVVDMSHFETQSRAEMLRNCHERLTKLCKRLRQHACKLSKSVEISGQPIPFIIKIRFWASNFMFSVALGTLGFPQGYFHHTLRLTKLCKGLRQHAFDLCKSIEISGQPIPLIIKISFWAPNFMVSAGFARTTSLNFSEFEAPWQFCNRMSRFCV